MLYNIELRILATELGLFRSLVGLLIYLFKYYLIHVNYIFFKSWLLRYISIFVYYVQGLQEVLKTNLGPKGTMKMLVSGAGDIKITKVNRQIYSQYFIKYELMTTSNPS